MTKWNFAPTCKLFFCLFTKMSVSLTFSAYVYLRKNSQFSFPSNYNKPSLSHSIICIYHLWGFHKFISYELYYFLLWYYKVLFVCFVKFKVNILNMFLKPCVSLSLSFHPDTLVSALNLVLYCKSSLSRTESQFLFSFHFHTKDYSPFFFFFFDEKLKTESALRRGIW